MPAQGSIMTGPHRHAFPFRLTAASVAAIAALAVLGAPGARAQTSQTVTISGRAVPPTSIGGFDDQATARTPISAGIVTAEQLVDWSITAPAALTRTDASFSDAYNAEGYWSSFTARGYVLDNRSNYRRDGLPINGETALQLSTIERVELLRGTSGIQAGISSPGGLVNLVVKRPVAGLRTARLEWQEDGTLGATVDLSDRFGPSGELGLRVNASAARLDPQTRDASGERGLLALAADWYLGPDHRVEFEAEWARQSQPSVPGLSLLGDRLPSAKQSDPRINLNNQPWSQPVVFDGTTASLRWQLGLAGGWRMQAHGAVQELRTDDRAAFPYGCYDAASDTYYADRYCPDGSFDLYDYRSEDERRRTAALDLRATGRLATGPWQHQLTIGVLATRAEDRFQPQAYNHAGQGRVDGSVQTPPAPDATTPGTNRDERTTELYLRDAIELSPDWSLWGGLRHTRLERESVRTDGTGATSYDQSFTTPWVALQRQLGRSTIAYASWGEGVESEVAPNQPRYANAGQPLPALKSRQFELGLKHAADDLEASVAAFDIRRSVSADLGACDVDGSCTRQVDGDARHRGVEGALALRRGPWQGQASAMWLHARREGASDPALNGLEPVNVPDYAIKLRAGYDVAALPGLTLGAGLVHEGPRQVLPDNSIELPSWTRLDLAARWATSLAERAVVWRLGVDNALDARAWRESPYQYGHVYLFPLQPRSWRASVQLTL
jgi:iron complex outermembrane receptor protein